MAFFHNQALESLTPEVASPAMLPVKIPGKLLLDVLYVLRQRRPSAAVVVDIISRRTIVLASINLVPGNDIIIADLRFRVGSTNQMQVIPHNGEAKHIYKKYFAVIFD
jgi:hypothetical protein